ncbi:MAG: phage holin, partial [Clostridium saudiense]|nr:phage holin [Clostridium saudiense]
VNMAKVLKSILTRLNNKGTIVALAALIVSLVVQFGFNIDSEKVLGIVNTICSILILLGVLNDPTENTNAYIPGVSDKLIDKE